MVEKKFRVVINWSLYLLTCLAKLSLFNNIVLNNQQQANEFKTGMYLNTAQRYWRLWFTYYIPRFVYCSALVQLYEHAS